MRKKILLINFGGPRNVEEVAPFLKELLTDGDVIRTPLPNFIQKFLFKQIARRRSKKIAEDYQEIGGKSPIFEDTEWVAGALTERGYDVLVFHRYLPATHADFLEKAHEFITEDTVVFPLFPQFSYATTGSIARWMDEHLCRRKSRILGWVKSYSEHKAFIKCFVRSINDLIQENGLAQKETLLFFSPHGLPVSYVFEGDVYKRECEKSYTRIMESFQELGSVIGYQSQFGRSEWIRPYTSELADSIKDWNKDFTNVVFIPLSFTSDHIETLFEVEQQYMKPVREAGFHAFRCPAFNRRADWVDAIEEIVKDADLTSTQMLIRGKGDNCGCKPVL
jgi:protoporphyrin/coproporphyrin ferrochelatase